MIGLILYLAIIGVIVWAIITFVPMPQQFKTLIVVVAVVLTLLWLLSVLGVQGPPIPKLQ